MRHVVGFCEAKKNELIAQMILNRRRKNVTTPTKPLEVIFSHISVTVPLFSGDDSRFLLCSVVAKLFLSSLRLQPPHSSL